MNVATESVEITPRGIRKVLNKYTPQRAIAEYIWNGYDAHAKEVRVNTIFENIFDSIIKVIVRDDGDGIIHEQLPVVFKKFYESHKSVKGNVDSRFSRGKNGYGRFTFFKFANLATWHTIYKKEDGFYKYTIDINAQTLTDYYAATPEKVRVAATGTEVIFEDIITIDESVVNAVIEYSEDKGYSPIQEKTDEGLFLFIPYKDNNPHEVVMGFCFDSEMIIPQGIKYKTKVYKLKRFYPHDEKTEDFFFDLVKNS